MTTPSHVMQLSRNRLLAAGFWFFLIKGLLWLILPAAGVWLSLIP